MIKKKEDGATGEINENEEDDGVNGRFRDNNEKTSEREDSEKGLKEKESHLRGRESRSLIHK